MEFNVQQSRHPSTRLLKFPDRRSNSVGDFCQNQDASPPQILHNQSVHSATSVSNIVPHPGSEDPPFLRPLTDTSKLFEPNQQNTSSKLNQQDFISSQDSSNKNYGFRLLKLDHRDRPPSNLRLFESVSLPKTPEISDNHLTQTDITPPKLLRPELLQNINATSAQQMGNDTVQCTQSVPSKLEPPGNFDKQNSQLMRIERMYKAKLAQMSNELHYLRRKSQLNLSKSLPDLSMADEVSALKMTISQLESEQIDTLKLALHFRDRFKEVSREKADLASRFLEASKMVELAEQKLAVVETARVSDLEEIELLKTRFAEALRDQEIQQRENLNCALNQSDARLETIKTTLLLAEKKAADSSARVSQMESKFEDAMKKIHALEIENRCLRDEKSRLEEEKKISLVNANFTSEKALKRLTFIQEQANMDEDTMRESIIMLKSQLQDALTRAEKCQTELELSNEEQTRLHNRIKSLETKSRQAENDLITATKQHELTMKELIETAQLRESQLTSALKQLTQSHETKISHAEEIINQQRQLLDKLRGECRSNVENFNIKLSQMEEQQRILLSEKEKAKELVISIENERNRIHSLNMEQLAQVDKLTRQVYLLEDQLSEKKFQMEHHNAKHRDVLMDAKLLAQEVKQLRTRILQNIPEKEDEYSGMRLFGSYEAQEAIKRIESLTV